LPALAIKLVAVEDEEALARLKSSSKVRKRQSKHTVHAGTVEFRFSRRYMKKLQKRGGQNSWRYMSRERATELARHANAIR
jgi:hypothetical protein